MNILSILGTIAQGAGVLVILYFGIKNRKHIKKEL